MRAEANLSRLFGGIKRKLRPYIFAPSVSKAHVVYQASETNSPYGRFRFTHVKYIAPRTPRAAGTFKPFIQRLTESQGLVV
jgi:hypothetical protein